MNEKNIHPLDFIFMEQKPDGDPNFSEEHNRRVIEGTIKKNNLLRAKRKREHEEGVRERASALATFFKSVERGGKTSKVEDYFGKREIARLRGEEIIDRLKKHAYRGKLVNEDS